MKQGQKAKAVANAPEVSEPSGPFGMLSGLPVRVPRSEAAELVSRYFFKVHPRSLERWLLPVRVINGRAHIDTADLFAEAQRRLDAADVVRPA